MKNLKIFLIMVLASCASRVQQPASAVSSFNPCAPLQRTSQFDAALECAARELKQDASIEAWEFFLAMRLAKQQSAEAKLLALMDNQQFAEAARLAESQWSASAPPEKLCELAELWFLAGDLGQAAQHYDRILEQMFLPPACALQGRAEIARLEAGAGVASLVIEPSQNESRWLDELQNASALTAGDVALLLVRLGPSRAKTPFHQTGLYDVATHPALPTIEEALARGWMQPAPYGLFRPERLVQRVELGLWLLDATLPQQERPQRSNLAGWRRAFPELAPLWELPPFQSMQSPQELFAPVSGSEAIEMIRRFRTKTSESD